MTQTAHSSQNKRVTNPFIPLACRIMAGRLELNTTVQELIDDDDQIELLLETVPLSLTVGNVPNKKILFRRALKSVLYRHKWYVNNVVKTPSRWVLTVRHPSGEILDEKEIRALTRDEAKDALLQMPAIQGLLSEHDDAVIAAYKKGGKPGVKTGTTRFGRSSNTKPKRIDEEGKINHFQIFASMKDWLNDVRLFRGYTHDQLSQKFNEAATDENDAIIEVSRRLCQVRAFTHTRTLSRLAYALGIPKEVMDQAHRAFFPKHVRASASDPIETPANSTMTKQNTQTIH